MLRNIAPLSGGFMITSIVGFLVTITFTMSGRISTSWGFSFTLIFVLMFIASLISMTYGPVEEIEKEMKNG